MTSENLSKMDVSRRKYSSTHINDNTACLMHLRCHFDQHSVHGIFSALTLADSYSFVLTQSKYEHGLKILLQFSKCLRIKDQRPLAKWFSRSKFLSASCGRLITDINVFNAVFSILNSLAISQSTPRPQPQSFGESQKKYFHRKVSKNVRKSRTKKTAHLACQTYSISHRFSYKLWKYIPSSISA